ncbi:exopolysaccharide Pel transporter PelG [Gorillibacterium sp. sgz5001074]|uniref:exopolysaccharide Pel transporter PelG n=1 Tax=Gorillibacterium sp. sgz5001074 TaxID=3446695 RepID=UPI003F67FC7E
MAGIGFELKRIVQGQKGYYYNFKAYAYSSLVTVGPMLLCMLMMVVMQRLIILAGGTHLEKEIFLASSEYAFVFSLLVTSPITMLISRFVSDKLYMKEHDDILPSFYGVTSVCLLVGGAAGAIFLYPSPLRDTYKLSLYLFFMELIVVWIQAIYISALKDYMRIVKSFIIGSSVSMLGAVISIFFFSWDMAASIITSMGAGFFVMAVMFSYHLERCFKSPNKTYFAFLAYFKQYPSLALIGVLQTVGFNLHNLLAWRSSMGIPVADTFVYAPSYDVPVFYAFLTVIPSMVIFVVSMETSFYEKYMHYFSSVLFGGTLQEIMKARKDMLYVLFQELSFMMEIQLFFSICSIAGGNRLLPMIGFSSEEVDTFTILVLGNFLYIFMFVLVLILLYFDDRKGAVCTTAILFVGNGLLNGLEVFGESHGFAFFVTALAALAVVMVRLLYVTKNINYYTYCSQPLVSGLKMTTGFRRLVGKWTRDTPVAPGGGIHL